MVRKKVKWRRRLLKNMEQQELAKIKNWRCIAPNEVVFEVDDALTSWLSINAAGIKLYYANYNFSIYYAEGQRGCHLHIYSIQGLTELSPEVRKKYKELFLQKYCPEADIKMVEEGRLIAAEFLPHFKYGTIKKLCGIWNEGNINRIELELLEQIKAEITKQVEINQNSFFNKNVVYTISLTQIARRYGLEVDKRGMALCPFHPDTNPSLKLYESDGIFICFGCGVKGNAIKFNYLLKKIYKKNKKISGVG